MAGWENKVGWGDGCEWVKRGGGRRCYLLNTNARVPPRACTRSKRRSGSRGGMQSPSLYLPSYPCCTSQRSLSFSLYMTCIWPSTWLTIANTSHIYIHTYHYPLLQSPSAHYISHHLTSFITSNYHAAPTQHHAAPRSITQHHAASRSITQHHAASRSITQHHAAPRSTTQHHAAP